MRDVPVTGRCASGRTGRRLAVAVATFALLASSAGVSHGAPTTQSQPLAQAQQPTPEEQFKTCQLKAEQGDVEAQFTLGGMYANGYGVWQDSEQAATWFLKAAGQGDAKAQVALGDAYARGQGVPRDDVQSATWYRKAAEQGDAAAQFTLAVVYADGVGVARDYVEALKWANLAGARASGDAPRVFADRLATKMTPAQVAEARQREQEWSMAHARSRR